MTENEVAEDIVDSAFQIHRRVGPGCLEAAYEAILTHELRKRGRQVRNQASVPLLYDGLRIGEAFKIDLLVDDLVIVELKAVEELHPVHFKQVITYLKFSDKRLGILLNFKVALFKKGVHRLVSNLSE